MNEMNEINPLNFFHPSEIKKHPFFGPEQLEQLENMGVRCNLNLKYDEEEILDLMFPDRHDEDFDPDFISWKHVFGDDE